MKIVFLDAKTIGTDIDLSKYPELEKTVVNIRKQLSELEILVLLNV